MHGYIHYYKKITPCNYHPMKKQNLASHPKGPPSLSPIPITAPKSKHLLAGLLSGFTNQVHIPQHYSSAGTFVRF